MQRITSKPKAAVYARVSTKKREQNPDVQLRELRRYCKARGLAVASELIDRASGATGERPGLKKLLALVRSRDVDTVVVVKLDRLFRSLKHLVDTLAEFEALGVTFIATRDQVDLSTPAGRMFVQILGSLSEFERALIRERVLMGLDYAVAHGRSLGRPKENDYKQIQNLRIQGLSYQQIQRKLRVSKGAVCRALSVADFSSSFA